MAETHTLQDTNIAELMKELDRIGNELDDYRLSMKKDARKTAPDMLLTPFKDNPRALSVTAPSAPAPAVNNERLKAIERNIGDMQDKMNQLDAISRKLDMLEDVDENMAATRHLVEDRLRVDFESMYRNLLDQMNIEAIKVYRNVQAVIVEENAKQNHVILGVDDKVGKLKRRMNHMMILAIVSFVVSILVMLMQILPALGINLF